MEVVSLIVACFLLVVYVLDYTLYKKMRKELNEATAQFKKNCNELNSLRSKTVSIESEICRLFRSLEKIAGPDLKHYLSEWFFAGFLPQKTYSLSGLGNTVDLLLKQLGYTFQSSTEEPAKLVKIEKKEDKKADAAGPEVKVGIWTMQVDENTVKILHDGKIVAKHMRSDLCNQEYK